MNLQQHIIKVLKEETEGIPKRTPLEKTILNFVEMETEGFDFPENFHGFAVDVYNKKRDCDITSIFKKPFTGLESDELHGIMRQVRKEFKKYFGDEFKLRTSSSTIGGYLDFYERYYKDRK